MYLESKAIRMASLALWIVRIARRLPHSAKFSRHLDECAALEVLHIAFDSEFPSLRASHVFGLLPLPDLQPRYVNMISKGFKVAIVPDQVIGSCEAVRSADPRLA